MYAWTTADKIAALRSSSIGPLSPQAVRFAIRVAIDFPTGNNSGRHDEVERTADGGELRNSSDGDKLRCKR